MDSRTRKRWEVRLVVLIVFVVGFLAGGLTMNLYRTGRFSPRDRGRGPFEQIVNTLNLTQDQKTQVNKIFEDARQQLDELRKESEPRFREVRKSTDEKLQAVLTPEQWEQFRRMTRRRARPFGPPRPDGVPR